MLEQALTMRLDMQQLLAMPLQQPQPPPLPLIAQQRHSDLQYIAQSAAVSPFRFCNGGPIGTFSGPTGLHGELYGQQLNHVSHMPS
jgi:hypothetical protein